MPRQTTSKSGTGTDASARDYAMRFGSIVRERREQLGLRQEDLAFTTGIGRRFIIELEAGKPSCQLGKALTIAIALGLRPFDLMTSGDDSPLLPDLSDDVGDADGR